MVQALIRPGHLYPKFYLKNIFEDRARGGNRRYFREINGEWRRRIVEYCKKKGNPENIAPSLIIGKNDKDKFKNLYESKNDNLSHVNIIKQWRNYWKDALNSCPCCGELGAPNTLDHYLPKESFPEYAVVLCNLIIMCDACQGEKGVDYLRNNKKIFFHNYYDDINRRLFQLAITGTPLSPTSFTIEPYQHLTRDLRDQVERHIDGLGLIKRFSSYCTAEYVSVIEDAKGCNQSGGNFLIEIEQEIVRQNRRGVNRWPTIFYEGLLRNQAVAHMLSTVK